MITGLSVAEGDDLRYTLRPYCNTLVSIFFTAFFPRFTENLSCFTKCYKRLLAVYFTFEVSIKTLRFLDIIV